MKRNKKRILVVIGSIVALIILIMAFWINSLLQDIHVGWEKEFTNAKATFKECSFSGTVIKRSFIGETVYPPFVLVIKLDTTVIMPLWGNSFYYEFYNFDFDEGTLRFSVSECIYKNTKINDFVVKKRGADSLQINDYPYLLLSKKDIASWVPDTEECIK